ncbi:MAG: hypothetical protein ACRDS0_09305 [Pseudonocardiaceae bacterium]
MDIGIGLPSTIPGTSGAAVLEWARQVFLTTGLGNARAAMVAPWRPRP